jgi:hypothetical protein
VQSQFCALMQLREQGVTQLYGPDIFTPLGPDIDELTAAAADKVCA